MRVACVLCAAACAGETRPATRLSAPLVADTGVSVHHFDLSHRTVTGIDAGGREARTSAAPMRAFDGVTFDADVGVDAGPAYFAVETQFGGGSIAHPLVGGDAIARGGSIAGAPFGVTGGGLLAAAGIVAGVSLGRSDALEPQLEVFAGGAGMFLTPDPASKSRYPCDGDGGCEVPGIATWIVEPRARVHGWVRRYVSIDGWAGYGIGPSAGDWSAGITAALHLREP